MFKVETFRELLNGGVRFHVVFGEWFACRELIDDLIGGADHFRGRPKTIRNMIEIMSRSNYGKKLCPANLQGDEKRFSPLASCLETCFTGRCVSVNACSMSHVV